MEEEEINLFIVFAFTLTVQQDKIQFNKLPLFNWNMLILIQSV